MDLVTGPAITISDSDSDDESDGANDPTDVQIAGCGDATSDHASGYADEDCRDS